MSSQRDPILEKLTEISNQLGRLNFADTAYPVWTDTVDYPNQLPLAGQPGAGAPGETRPDSARGTIGAVLGWRLNPSDPAGFVAALNRAFRLVEDEQGNTTARWVPPSYSVQSLEVGLGAVTGAQASLLAQARVAVEQVRPLIEGLTPLDPDSDREDVEAVRGLILSELQELVNQLGTEGGPVPQRVDSSFDLLLGAGITNTGPNGDQIKPYDVENGGGQLGLLRERLHLESGRVNTIDEEERLTNFLIVISNIDTMRVTWLTQRKNFRGADASAFLGTQLVLLTRALLVVAESVQEIYFALDSVFVGPSERQVTLLPTTPQKITVAELLSWVEEIASKKGLDVIRNSGKDGIIHAFSPVVSEMRRLVHEVAAVINHEPPADRAAAQARARLRAEANLPPGLYTQRVVVAWLGLAAHLGNVLELVRPIRRTRPRIVAVEPERAPLGAVPRLAIDGEDFGEGARVFLTRRPSAQVSIDFNTTAADIEGTEVTLVSETQIDANFDLDEPAAPGTWSVVVVNADGSIAYGADLFEIEADTGAGSEEDDEEDEGDDEGEEEDEGDEDGTEEGPGIVLSSVEQVNRVSVVGRRSPFAVTAGEINIVEVDGEGFGEAADEDREMIFSFGHSGVFVEQRATWTAAKTLESRFYIAPEVPHGSPLTLVLIDVPTGESCGSLAGVLRVEHRGKDREQIPV